MHICHIKHSNKTDNIDEVLLTSISIIYHIYIPFCFTETSYGGLKSCPFEFLPVSFNQCNTFKPYSVFSRHVNFSTRVPVWVHTCRFHVEPLFTEEHLCDVLIWATFWCYSRSQTNAQELKWVSSSIFISFMILILYFCITRVAGLI